MMTALLLNGYCNRYLSRRIAKACRERVDFMSVVGLDAPDFRTISEFRKRHLQALSALFSQALRLCERAGLVKLGHVALDGTKIKANASRHKAVSYGRMAERAAELEAEVAGWMDAAAATDGSEDAAFGRDNSGDEMPNSVADKKRRTEKIRTAKAELEAEAEKKREAEGRKKRGRPAAPPSEDPDPKAQKNFTDPENRIMKTKDGFIQGYNAQAAVDAEAQVIVAHGVDAHSSDQHQLTPMVDAVEANMGRKPEQVSADAGYCSDANLEAMESRKTDAYIPAGRAKHPADGEGGSKRVAAMREKIRAGGHDTPYRPRKQMPEPVFGRIKQARGFRQFLMRARQRRPRMGPRPPRPQHAQARPGTESVRRPDRNRLTPRQPAKQPKSASTPGNTLQINLTADTIRTDSEETIFVSFPPGVRRRLTTALPPPRV